MKKRPEPTAPLVRTSAHTRVTMADVARVARVHRSTVSLALRHQSKIPAATRERILKAAAELGYTPDPLLDAFNFQRLTAHPTAGSLSIAFVSDLPSGDAFETSPLHREALHGARENARRLGFAVAVFLTGPGQLSPVRLDRVLQSRGLTCIIVGALSRRTETLSLDWSRYCVVAIDSFHLQPALDTVTLDHRAACRRAIGRLRAAGHVRIGFVSSAEEDFRLCHLPLSGYLLEAANDPAAVIPPLLLQQPRGDEAEKKFQEWHVCHRPTALIAGCTLTAAAVRSGRLPAPRGGIWIGTTESIDATDPAGGWAAYRNLGARAAELLPLRRQVNQCGVAAHRTTIVLALSPG